jgi:hypothetical protein
MASGRVILLELLGLVVAEAAFSLLSRGHLGSRIALFTLFATSVGGLRGPSRHGQTAGRSLGGHVVAAGRAPGPSASVLRGTKGSRSRALTVPGGPSGRWPERERSRRHDLRHTHIIDDMTGRAQETTAPIDS